MMMFFRNVAATLILVVAQNVAASAEYAPQVDQPHDDFVLPRIVDRKPVWLSQFRGQKVLLIQFASW